MRIAQVSPLYESVPPKLYGGTERVVSYLTEELVDLGPRRDAVRQRRLGHRRRLVAARRARCGCDESCETRWRTTCACWSRSSRAPTSSTSSIFTSTTSHFPMSRARGVPHLATMHGRLDVPDLQPLYRTFADVPLVSISDSQRAPLPFANWCGTVYHGLPLDLYPLPRRAPGKYLAFLGRVSPEKGVDRAIEIARRGHAAEGRRQDRQRGSRLSTTSSRAAARDPPTSSSWARSARRDKDEFLGGAAALLFPIDWPEPFGLVMIEAMACGTPVVAFRRGSVPEVMRDGVSGYVVDTSTSAVEATARGARAAAQACRAVLRGAVLGAGGWRATTWPSTSACWRASDGRRAPSAGPGPRRRQRRRRSRLPPSDA